MQGLCILSGGIDSSTVLFKAVAELGASNVHALTFDYGQKHLKETDRAFTIANAARVKTFTHQKISLPGSAISGHSGNPKELEGDIPNVGYDEIHGVSPTYVPFRNGTFISHAAATAMSQAEAYQEQVTLYIGTHAEDALNDAYPDCRLDFIGAMAAAIYIGTYHKVKLAAPFIQNTKAEIVKVGDQLGVPFELSWSCYRGQEFHCGVCPTCRARKDAFRIAMVKDPTEYADQMLNIP